MTAPVYCPQPRIQPRLLMQKAFRLLTGYHFSLFTQARKHAGMHPRLHTPNWSKSVYYYIFVGLHKKDSDEKSFCLPIRMWSLWWASRKGIILSNYRTGTGNCRCPTSIIKCRQHYHYHQYHGFFAANMKRTRKLLTNFVLTYSTSFKRISNMHNDLCISYS